MKRKVRSSILIGVITALVVGVAIILPASATFAHFFRTISLPSTRGHILTAAVDRYPLNTQYRGTLTMRLLHLTYEHVVSNHRYLQTDLVNNDGAVSTLLKAFDSGQDIPVFYDPSKCTVLHGLAFLVDDPYAIVSVILLSIAIATSQQWASWQLLDLSRLKDDDKGEYSRRTVFTEC
jgi:hypothetical protein